MKEIVRKAGLVSAFALATALSSAALATPFTITGAAFTGISTSGYGSETKAVEDGLNATLLEVIFDTSGFLSQDFTLTNVNDTFGFFNFGKVTFNEKDISQKEVDNPNLGVSATFTFAKPGVGAKTVTATGTAVFGKVPGNETNLVDFTINWTPLTVDFGSTGSFKIDLEQLAFTTNNQELPATARVTLLSLDTVATPPSGKVPEPGSLALAGLGLAAAGFASRRKR